MCPLYLQGTYSLSWWPNRMIHPLPPKTLCPRPGGKYSRKREPCTGRLAALLPAEPGEGDEEGPFGGQR